MTTIDPTERNPFSLLIKCCEKLIEEETQRYVTPVVKTFVISGHEFKNIEFPRDFTESDRQYGERQIFKKEIDGLLAECQVQGYRVWQPRSDDLNSRLTAIVEALYALEYWRHHFENKDLELDQARDVLNSRVSELRAACKLLEPIDSKFQLDNGRVEVVQHGGANREIGIDEPTGVQQSISDPTDDTKRYLQLLNVFTGGIADEKFHKAAAVIGGTMTVNEKLVAIHQQIPIPNFVSAKRLGDGLGVSSAAIQKTAWWKQNRKGEGRQRINDRRERHKERAGQLDGPGFDDDE